MTGPVLSVTSYRHPDEFPPDALQFFALAAQQSMESSAWWYRNLIDTVFSQNERVRIYFLRKNGQTVAALPLVASKDAMGYRVEALSNYYTSIYAPLIAEGVGVPELSALLDAIKRDHPPLISIKLAPMASPSAHFTLLHEAMLASGLTPFGFFCFGNWYLDVKDEWPVYFQNRDGAIRSTIKRMSKKFFAIGGSLELILGGDELERGLAAFEQVYAASWKSAEPFPNFVPGLIRICAAQGCLRLGVAWLKGEPIAAQLWMVVHGKASIYKLAYDEKYKSFASGTLLTAMLMEQAMAIDRVKEVDYLIGDDPYKKAWMSHRRERWGVVAYNPKSFGGLMGVAKEMSVRGLKSVLASVKKLINMNRTQQN